MKDYYVASVTSTKTHFTEAGHTLWLAYNNAGEPVLTTQKTQAHRFLESDLLTEEVLKVWNRAQYWYEFNPATLSIHRATDD